MQIVPEMDTVMNIGNTNKTDGQENAKAEGFMMLLGNIQSKFSQMLGEEPELALVGLNRISEETAEEEAMVSAENLIMTENWMYMVPEKNEMTEMIGIEPGAADEESGEIMIGGRSGSLYGRMHVAAGKDNPMMTGSSLLRSFGVSRNPNDAAVTGNNLEFRAITDDSKVGVIDMAKVNLTDESKVYIPAEAVMSTENDMDIAAKQIAGVLQRTLATRTIMGSETAAEHSSKLSARTEGQGIGAPEGFRIMSGHEKAVLMNQGKGFDSMMSDDSEEGASGFGTGTMTGDSRGEVKNSGVINKVADFVLDESMKSSDEVRTQPLKSDKEINFPGTVQDVKVQTAMPQTAVKGEFAVPESIDTADVIKQVIDKVNVIRLEDGNSINVRLTPDTLGSISISLEMTSRGLSAIIAATNPDVQGALNGSIDQLATVLADYGISQDRIDVVPGEGYYGEQDSNGFMFDDGSRNGREFQNQGHSSFTAETQEEESVRTFNTRKDESIINIYG